MLLDAYLTNHYGAEINSYAFQDMDKFKGVIDNVVFYVTNSDIKYDRRWVNLHGLKKNILRPMMKTRI